MRALVLLVALLPLAGCAAEDAEEPGTTLDRTERLSPAPYPRSVHELNLELESGATASWSYEATGPLSWDVHTHEGANVVTLGNGTGSTAEGTIRATAAGVYSLFLQNPDRERAVDVTIRVRGDFVEAPTQ